MHTAHGVYLIQIKHLGYVAALLNYSDVSSKVVGPRGYARTVGLFGLRDIPNILSLFGDFVQR